nr:MAG TPA: hypothetical protein [Inoviridae sp.]
MKKKFVSLALCMALLSSFTVFASAEFDNTDSSNLATLTKYCSSLWQGANFRNRSYNNWCYMLGDALTDIYDVNSGLVQRVIEIQSQIDVSNQHLGTISSSLGVIDSHIASASDLNHSDLSALLTFFDEVFTTQYSGPESKYSNAYRFYIYNHDSGEFRRWLSLGGLIDTIHSNFTSDSGFFSSPTLYKLVHQLQQVLASDADLQLKNDNKANEDAATDAFVNGNSSNTSLGPGDFGNLKDVGGSFNDLTSLNGQSSVSSFLNGLTSADGTGQGWFSESTRSSLDAVSPPPTNKVRAYYVYRGERSSTYVVLPDVSLVSPDMYSEPVDVAASVSSDDPYNMSGFEDNYNWLWGDVS